jgi:hypothetical protein
LPDSLFSNKKSQFLVKLEYKMVVHFITIWNGLGPLGIIYGLLVQFGVIWYIFPVLVCLDQEKSGNPGTDFFFRKRDFFHNLKKR